MTKSFACVWGSAAQWAQALTEEGLFAALEEFAVDDHEQTAEEFAEDEPTAEAFAELHRRLLTEEGELRRVLEPGKAAIILGSVVGEGER